MLRFEVQEELPAAGGAALQLVGTCGEVFRHFDTRGLFNHGPHATDSLIDRLAVHSFVHQLDECRQVFHAAASRIFWLITPFRRNFRAA